MFLQKWITQKHTHTHIPLTSTSVTSSMFPSRSRSVSETLVKDKSWDEPSRRQEDVLNRPEDHECMWYTETCRELRAPITYTTHTGLRSIFVMLKHLVYCMNKSKDICMLYRIWNDLMSSHRPQSAADVCGWRFHCSCSPNWTLLSPLLSRSATRSYSLTAKRNDRRITEGCDDIISWYYSKSLGVVGLQISHRGSEAPHRHSGFLFGSISASEDNPSPRDTVNLRQDVQDKLRV